MSESAAPTREIPATGHWDVAAEYTTAQTDQELVAAPGVGFQLYVTDIYLVAADAIDITLEKGGSSLLFKYYASAKGDGVGKGFKQPLKLPENTSITITTSAAVAVTAVLTGYVRAL